MSILLQLLLLMLFCFIHHSGTSTVPVTGKKGGNITLTCEYKAREISDIRFIRHRKRIHFAVIPVCPKEDKRVLARVCRKEACDFVIKDLIFSDAGNYIFRFIYRNDLTELTYQLHIYDEISVNIGQKLKLDVLLTNADKVEHRSRNSIDWKEVWKRGHGVQNEQLNDRDGNLIISNFTANDAGTYRVLDSEGNILITVNVVEGEKKISEPPGPLSGNGSKQLNHWIGLPVFYWWFCLF